MDSITIFTAGAVASTALCALPGTLNRSLVARVSAVTFFAAASGAAFVGMVDQQSRPKSIDWEVMSRTTEATVQSFVLQPDQAIYVWLLLPGDTVPRSYVLPWRTNTAKQLMAAKAEGDQNGRGVKIAHPFEKTLSQEEPMIYPEPQEKMPDKPEEAAPMEYKG